MNKKLFGLFVILVGAFFVLGVRDVMAQTIRCVYEGSPGRIMVDVTGSGVNITVNRQAPGFRFVTTGYTRNDFLSGSQCRNSVEIMLDAIPGISGQQTMAITLDRDASGPIATPRPPAPPLEVGALCEAEMLGIFRFIGRILLIFRIVIPIIIIVLGSIDLGKAVTGSNDDAIKKSSISLLRRAVFGIMIFFLPTIVYVAFNLIDGVRGTSTGSTACAQCLARPNRC